MSNSGTVVGWTSNSYFRTFSFISFVTSHSDLYTDKSISSQGLRRLHATLHSRMYSIPLSRCLIKIPSNAFHSTVSTGLYCPWGDNAVIQIH